MRDSRKQKNVASGLKQMLEINGLLYHAVATASDVISILIVSNKRASQNHDDKICNKTEHRKKLKFTEYLVMYHFSVQPETFMSHVHNLGVHARVAHSFCAQFKA